MWGKLEVVEWSFGLQFGERERRRRLTVAIVGAGPAGERARGTGLWEMQDSSSR